MASSPQAPDRNLAMELVRVTEAAAMAAARWMGRGDKNGADGAAVAAMRTILATVQMEGVIVIGEGEKDDAPMLYAGEKIGTGEPPAVDIAVDPIDGTSLAAYGRNNALSVIAVAERGSMFDPGPCFYMEKIAVGPEAAHVIDINASVKENLRAIANAKGKHTRDITVMILDRPRHAALIAEVREANARVQLISDGDVAGAIATARPESGVDVLLGIGGTPEGVITAAAMQCMGGALVGRLAPQSDTERDNVLRAGYDLTKTYTERDLVRSDNCFFAATGITAGDLFDGVQFTPDGATTHSLVMRSKSGTVRKVEATHKLAKLTEYAAIEFR